MKTFLHIFGGFVTAIASIALLIYINRPRPTIPQSGVFKGPLYMYIYAGTGTNIIVDEQPSKGLNYIVILTNQL